MNEDRLLVSIYEQHWLHARHVENERLWLTNIHALILTGVFTFIFKNDHLFETFPEIFLVVLLFLIVFTTLGFFFSLKVNLIFWWHTSKAKEILQDRNLLKYWIDTFKRPPISGRVYITVLFQTYYTILLSFLTGLMVFVLLKKSAIMCEYQIWICSIMASIVISILFILIVYIEHKWLKNMVGEKIS